MYMNYIFFSFFIIGLRGGRTMLPRGLTFPNTIDLHSIEFFIRLPIRKFHRARVLTNNKSLLCYILILKQTMIFQTSVMVFLHVIVILFKSARWIDIFKVPTFLRVNNIY